MMRTLKLLLQDESGFVASSELVLMGTILTIGAIAGMMAVRDAVVTELADVGVAIGALDQSYSYGDVVTPCGTVSGSEFVDESDFCDPVLSDDFPPTLLPVVDIGGAPASGEGS